MSRTTDEIVSDSQLVRRMVETHERRFDDHYWNVFKTLVAPRLPQGPTVADLGCGPGLFIHDLTDRLPGALLTGFDKSPEMLAAARATLGHHSAVSVVDHDFEAGMPAMEEASLDLITMNFFFHYFDWPLPLLEFVRTRLNPDHGVLQVFDWVRTPLREYIANVDRADDQALRARFSLFPRHNRYTFEDLLWLLVDSGFQVLFAERIKTSHGLVLATPRLTGKL